MLGLPSLFEIAPSIQKGKACNCVDNINQISAVSFELVNYMPSLTHRFSFPAATFFRRFFPLLSYATIQVASFRFSDSSVFIHKENLFDICEVITGECYLFLIGILAIFLFP